MSIQVNTSRRYRYRITDVNGSMAGCLSPDDVIVESEWKGQKGTWEVVNKQIGKVVGSFSGDYLGRVVAAQGDAISKSGAADAAERE